MSAPIRAEWASGKRVPISLSLLLFFGGGTTLFLIAVLAPQGAFGAATGVPVEWVLLTGGWAFVAVLIALSLRKNDHPLLKIVAVVWSIPIFVAIAFGVMLRNGNWS